MCSERTGRLLRKTDRYYERKQTGQTNLFCACGKDPSLIDN